MTVQCAFSVISQVTSVPSHSRLSVANVEVGHVRVDVRGLRSSGVPWLNTECSAQQTAVPASALRQGDGPAQLAVMQIGGGAALMRYATIPAG
jgi:hypothetical protein